MTLTLLLFLHSLANLKAFKLQPNVILNLTGPAFEYGFTNPTSYTSLIDYQLMYLYKTEVTTNIIFALLQKIHAKSD